MPSESSDEGPDEAETRAKIVFMVNSWMKGLTCSSVTQELVLRDKQDTLLQIHVLAPMLFGTAAPHSLPLSSKWLHDLFKVRIVKTKSYEYLSKDEIARARLWHHACRKTIEYLRMSEVINLVTYVEFWKPSEPTKMSLDDCRNFAKHVETVVESNDKDQLCAATITFHHFAVFVKEAVEKPKFTAKLYEEQQQFRAFCAADEKKVSDIREKGNQAFKNVIYEDAVKYYTQAIELCPFSCILYCNRSQANLALKRHEWALSDALRSVVLDPTFLKGQFRYAEALFETGKRSEAMHVNLLAQQKFNLAKDIKYLQDQHERFKREVPDDLPELVSSESEPEDRTRGAKSQKKSAAHKRASSKKAHMKTLKETTSAKRTDLTLKLSESVISAVVPETWASKVQRALTTGGAAMIAANHKQAKLNYDACLRMLASPQLAEEDQAKPEQVFILRYACGMACLRLEVLQDVNLGLEYFRGIVDNAGGSNFPLAYYGMGMAYMCFARYRIALTHLINGVQAMSKLQDTPSKFCWPGTDVVIEESRNTLAAFEKSMLACKYPPKPDAICRSEECLSISPQREIYFISCCFEGLVTLSCCHRCLTHYHVKCWQVLKSRYWERLADKEIIGKPCLTPSCNGRLSRIATAIRINGEDKKKEVPPAGDLLQNASKVPRPRGHLLKLPPQSERSLERKQERSILRKQRRLLARRSNHSAQTATSSSVPLATSQQLVTDKRIERGNECPFADDEEHVMEDLRAQQPVTILRKDKDGQLDENHHNKAKVAKKKKKLKTVLPLEAFIGQPNVDDDCDTMSTDSGSRWPSIDTVGDSSIFIWGRSHAPVAARDDSCDGADTASVSNIQYIPASVQASIRQSLVSFFVDILSKRGPMHVEDVLVTQYLVNCFPPEALDVVSHAGGIKSFLLQYPQFGAVDNHVHVISAGEAQLDDAEGHSPRGIHPWPCGHAPPPTALWSTIVSARSQAVPFGWTRDEEGMNDLSPDAATALLPSMAPLNADAPAWEPGSQSATSMIHCVSPPACMAESNEGLDDVKQFIDPFISPVDNVASSSVTGDLATASLWCTGEDLFLRQVKLEPLCHTKAGINGCIGDRRGYHNNKEAVNGASHSASRVDRDGTCDEEDGSAHLGVLTGNAALVHSKGMLDEPPPSLMTAVGTSVGSALLDDFSPKPAVRVGSGIAMLDDFSPKSAVTVGSSATALFDSAIGSCTMFSSETVAPDWVVLEELTESSPSFHDGTGVKRAAQTVSSATFLDTFVPKAAGHIVTSNTFLLSNLSAEATALSRYSAMTPDRLRSSAALPCDVTTVRATSISVGDSGVSGIVAKCAFHAGSGDATAHKQAVRAQTEYADSGIFISDDFENRKCAAMTTSGSSEAASSSSIHHRNTALTSLRQMNSANGISKARGLGLHDSAAVHVGSAASMIDGFEPSSVLTSGGSYSYLTDAATTLRSEALIASNLRSYSDGHVISQPQHRECEHSDVARPYKILHTSTAAVTPSNVPWSEPKCVKSIPAVQRSDVAVQCDEGSRILLDACVQADDGRDVEFASLVVRCETVSEELRLAKVEIQQLVEDSAAERAWLSDDNVKLASSFKQIENDLMTVNEKLAAETKERQAKEKAVLEQAARLLEAEVEAESVINELAMEAALCQEKETAIIELTTFIRDLEGELELSRTQLSEMERRSKDNEELLVGNISELKREQQCEFALLEQHCHDQCMRARRAEVKVLEVKYERIVSPVCNLVMHCKQRCSNSTTPAAVVRVLSTYAESLTRSVFELRARFDEQAHLVLEQGRLLSSLPVLSANLPKLSSTEMAILVSAVPLLAIVKQADVPKLSVTSVNSMHPAGAMAANARHYSEDNSRGHTSVKEQPPAPQAASSRTSDRLLDKLTTTYTVPSRHQLERFVQQLRASRNGSLTGMSLDAIVRRVGDIMQAELHLEHQAKAASVSLPQASRGGPVPTTFFYPTAPALLAPLPAALAASDVFQEETDPCIICHDEMTLHETTQLDCKHTYHTHCIKSWFKEQSTCPICRSYALLPEEFPCLL